MRILLALLFLFSLTPSLPAHPGGRNKEGCHVCKKNCAKWDLKEGEYHCHNKKDKDKKVKPEAPSKKPLKKKKPKRS